MSILKGIPFLRQELTKIFMKRAADKSGIMRIPFKNKDLQLDIEDRVQKYIRDAEKQGVDLDMVSNENLKYTINLNENVDPISRAISADSPEGRKITEALLGKRNNVVDMTGKKIDTSQGIVGGKSMKELMESGQVKKGTEGIKKSKKVKDREMFQKANEKFNKTEAQIKAEIEASNKKYVEKIKDNRKMTDEEYAEFIEDIGGEERLEAFDFDGTVGSGKKALKEDRDYFNEMELEYKKGNLDPKPGEKYRKEFLQKKLNDAELSGDKRLMSREEREELFDLENTPVDPEDMADGGVAGLLGERTGYQIGGSPAIDARMQNTRAQNIKNIGDARLQNTRAQNIKNIGDARLQQTYQQNIDDQNFKNTFAPAQEAVRQRMRGVPEQRAPQQQKGLYDVLSDAASLDKISQLESQYNQGKNLPTSTGIISDARHQASLSQLRDTIANQLALTPKGPGAIAKTVGGIGALGAGVINELGQLVTKPSEAIEDLKSNWQGVTTIPYGQTPEQTYSQAIEKYTPQKTTEEIARASQYGDAAATPTPDAGTDKPTMADVAGPSEVERFKKAYDEAVYGMPSEEVNWYGTGRPNYDKMLAQYKNWNMSDPYFSDPEMASKFKSLYGKSSGYGLASGGIARQNFAMGRRAFLKLMGGIGAGIGAAKAGLGSLFKAGKPITKAAEIVTPAAKGKPAWFDALVTRVINEGDDVTKKFATKDREIVHTTKIDDDATVTVYRDLNTDNVRVDIDDATKNVMDDQGNATVSLEVRSGKSLADETTGPTTPGNEFEAVETDYRNYMDGPDDFVTENVENVVNDTKNLTADLTKVKLFAKGQKKPTIKEIMIQRDRAKTLKQAEDTPAEYAADRGPEFDPDYDDYASGGIARMLGE